MIILCLLIVLLINSCVPPKKFYEMESNYKTYYEKSKKDDVTIANLKKVNGEYLMKNLSLEKDTLKLFYSYDKLLKKYLELSEFSSVQLANSQRLLKDKNVEIVKKEQNARNIEYALKTIDFELNAIYRTINSKLQRYSQSGVHIENSFWNITISIADDFMYEDSSYSSLSSAGKHIIASIVSVINESDKEKFNLEIRELSRPQTKTVIRDSVIVYKVKTILSHPLPKKDSLEFQEIINIEVENDKVNTVKIASLENIPASMIKGSTIVKYLEKNSKNMSYTGTIYLSKPKEFSNKVDISKRVDIVIEPNLSAFLNTINNIKL